MELEEKAFMGDAFFTAPNPPFGAVFTYYLKESLKTSKQQRQETEKNLEKQGKIIKFPGWDTLRQEDREEEPAIILTVKDEAGNVVRHITGPTGKGMHRVVWDLRYPSIAPTKLEQPKDVDPWDRPPEGLLVVPGTFSVSLAKRVDGVLTSLGKSRTVVVESLGLAALPAKDKKELLDFQKKAGELQRAMMGADAAIKQALKNLQFIKKALLDTPNAPEQLGEKAQALEKQLKNIHVELSGDPITKKRSEPRSPSLLQRVGKEAIQASSTTGITTTNKHNYEIAATAFEKLLEKLRQLIEVDFKKLEAKMEAAGAPWTPGRGVPRWKKK
jgi:tetratricopeptide (TPR) repeat protein